MTYIPHNPLIAGAIGFICTFYCPLNGQFLRDSDFCLTILNCKLVKKIIRTFGTFKLISQVFFEIHVLIK